MRKILTYLSILLFAGLVTACGKSVDGPSSEDIRSALSVDLPVGMTVDSVDVVAAENTGSTVEPSYRTRSNVVLKLTENFYKQTGSVDDKPLVKETGKKGDEIKAVVITNAKPVGDNDWKVSIESLDMPRMTGQAESKFGSDGVIVEDSKEHKAALDAEKKKAADAENKREAELTSARNKFIGTWKSSQPALYRDMVYSNNGHKMGMALTINSFDGTVGSGTAKVYVYSNPQESVDTPISVNLDASGDYLTVSFDEQLRHQGLNVYLSGAWRLTPDGKFSDGRGGNGRFMVQLAKN